MNICRFSIEKRSGYIIYCHKIFKMVVFDVTSRKPGGARGARIWFSSQGNQARIIRFVNNLYQNYHVSLNYFCCRIISKHNKSYQQTIPFIDCFISTQLYKRCKVINSVSDGTNILAIHFSQYKPRYKPSQNSHYSFNY